MRNAKIGRKSVYKPTIGNDSLHDESNENGNKLITFVTARNMVVSSIKFPHKNIHKKTWISPYGRIRNQIDHIIVDWRIRSSVENVRSMRGCSAISDHFLVKIKFRLKISIDWQKKNNVLRRKSTRSY
uniref:Craniofacial development protein 2 n=1 Tax=Sipha flava TaxID=143950 RepID=A0A2S2R622_9HEMI